MKRNGKPAIKAIIMIIVMMIIIIIMIIIKIILIIIIIIIIIIAVFPNETTTSLVHIKGKYVVGLKLEAMFRFSLSLRISVVLPIVNHSRIWLVVKQSYSCKAILSVHDVKLQPKFL